MALMSALRTGRPLPLGNFLGLIFVRGSVDREAIVRLEILGQFKYPVTSLGNQTRNLLACSIMPQPTTLLRATPIHTYEDNIKMDLKERGCGLDTMTQNTVHLRDLGNM
jgi:hypothetical protein